MASKLRSALVVLPLAALIALTGCTAETIPDRGISTPEASASEAPSEFVSAIPADELGLVLPGAEVETADGSFRKAVLNADLAAENYIKLDGMVAGDELKDAGFTDEAVAQAQEQAYRTLIELNLDGPLFESDATTLEWYESGGEDAFAPEVREMIHSSLQNSPTEALFVQNAFGAPLIADGDLRLKDVSIETESLMIQWFEGKPYVLVNLVYSGEYRSTTDGILATLQSIEGSDYTRADMESLSAELEADEADYTVRGTAMLSYGLGNFDQAAGMVFNYSTSLTTPEGAAIPLGSNS